MVKSLFSKGEALKPMERILIVEDEVNTALSLTELLEIWGYAIIGPASTGEEAIRLAKTEMPDVVLMDVKIRGDMDGLEAGGLINSQLGIPVILMTGYFENETTGDLKVNKKIQYISKPLDLAKLKSMLKVCLGTNES